MATNGKYTLLEIVQTILNDLNSDDVNSISDTVESLQVADMVKSAYIDIMGGLRDPHRKDIFPLVALSDTSKPNYMRIPLDCLGIERLYYDKEDGRREITFIEPEEFVDLSIQRESLTNITSVDDFSSISYNIINDKDPTYYTSFDDDYLVFDSWNNSVDTTLQQSKSVAIGYKEPAWSMTDSFVPDLPVNYFPYLISSAKVAAFINIKQASNANEDRRARRQMVRLQNDRHRARKKQFNQANKAAQGRRT